LLMTTRAGVMGAGTQSAARSCCRWLGSTREWYGVTACSRQRRCPNLAIMTADGLEGILRVGENTA